MNEVRVGFLAPYQAGDTLFQRTHTSASYSQTSPLRVHVAHLGRAESHLSRDRAACQWSSRHSKGG